MLTTDEMMHLINASLPQVLADVAPRDCHQCYARIYAATKSVQKLHQIIREGLPQLCAIELRVASVGLSWNWPQPDQLLTEWPEPFFGYLGKVSFACDYGHSLTTHEPVDFDGEHFHFRYSYMRKSIN